MEAHEFFLQLALILISARILAELASRLGVPTVIGELMAGIILGPSLLGWLHVTEQLQLMAEIGIILLLFKVGLETDFDHLAHAGRNAIAVALVGFTVPFVLGYATARYLFGFDNMVALMLGGTLTATSIGVTVRILQDVGRQNSMEGQVVLGAAVVDDVLGVILLATLYQITVDGQISVLALARIIAFVGIFFLLAPLLARLLSAGIQRLLGKTTMPGLIPSTIIALVLLFASLANLLGAPELLGGFAAGIALSRRFFLPFGISLAHHSAFAERIDIQTTPIIQLFTPIFFVVVGLSLDLRQVDWGSAFIWIFSLTVLSVAILGKLVGGQAMPNRHPIFRLAVGISMVPRGEVGLIFAELGRAAGVFGPQVYAGLVIVIAYTTLLAPFWIKLFYRRYGHHPSLEEGEEPPPEIPDQGFHPG
jgi:Kef-type K+ transport system membrane component KefB